MTRLTLRLALAATAGAVLTAFAPPAHAGMYTVHACRTPSGAWASVADGAGGFEPGAAPSPRTGLRSLDSCGNGGALQADIGGPNDLGSGQVEASWGFVAPSNTTIVNYTLDWDGWAVPTGYGKAGYAVVFDPRGGVGSDHGGEGGIARQQTTAVNREVPWFAFAARCASGGTTCGRTGDAGDARMTVYRASVDLRDDSSPTVSAVSGDAVTESVWHGDMGLSFSASDTGGGVKDVVVTIGGREVLRQLVDDNGGRCADLGGRQYRHARPCRTSVGAAPSIPSGGAPEGRQPVVIRLVDAAGNEALAYSATKTVDNLAPVQAQPQVTGQEARVGRELGCTPAVDGQSPALSFQWLRAAPDGSGQQAIAGATAQTYTPTDADAGRKLLCRVTATDAGGTSVQTSAITSGPFADGATVRTPCEGRPAGPKDPCGDLDADGTRNQDDADADGDGVGRAADPDDLDRAVTGRDVARPSSWSGSVAQSSSATTEARSTVVADGPAGQPNGRGASPAATLTAHHERTTSRTLRAAYGRRVVIRGRLLAPDGRPVEGAKLDVFAQDRAASAAFEPLTAVQTDATGAYELVLPAGPSRNVRIGYRARFGDTSFAQTADVAVLVKAAIRFRLSHRRLRNGRTVRYLGRLLGPRTGHRFAEVQVLDRSRWIVVCSVRTDARGSFACAHRFTRTFRRTTYVFRARVRRQATLPYEPAVSSTRRLAVRP